MGARSDANTTDSTYTFEVDPAFPSLPDGKPLDEVAGVALAAQGRVIIVNRSDVPVQMYTTDGQFISAWAYDDFSRVHGVTVGPDGVIYITDDLRHVVRVFSPEGELLRTLGTPGEPSDTGAGDSLPRVVQHGGPPFNQPTNTAVGLDGSLFISDGYGNARVHQFSPDGQLRKSWGEPGSGPGEFNLPHGVAIDTQGRVLVADRENNRIQVFTPDGEFVSEYTDLIRPCALYVDDDGMIYVAELGRSHGRVSILSPEGQVLARWTIEGEVAEAGGHSVTLDSDGNLYIGLVYQGETPPVGAHPVIKYRRVPA